MHKTYLHGFIAPSGASAIDDTSPLNMFVLISSCCRCFSNASFFLGRVVGPTQTHLISGATWSNLSHLYPLTCPAWVTLPGACAPAGIALRVIEKLKPPPHGKGWAVWPSLSKHTHISKCQLFKAH